MSKRVGQAMTKTSRLIGLFMAASLIVTGCTTNANKDCLRNEEGCERSSGGGSSGIYGGGSSKKDGGKKGWGGIGGRSGSSSGG